MDALNNSQIKDLTDKELRNRLLALNYDVPVSVNRDFLVKKLESLSAGGGKSKLRHSIAVTPTLNNSSSQGGRGSPNSVRKRKSLAASPPVVSNREERRNANKNENSIPLSPLASSPITDPVTPQYSSSPSTLNTPSTPSPFVSRFNTPSPAGSPMNGETGSHSPRYNHYLSMFKTGGEGGNSRSGDGEGYGYGYGYNKSIRLSPPGNFNPVTSVAPPTRTGERNGYAGGATASSGVESEWFGGHLVSKILLIGFVLFFIILGVLYIRQNMHFDPRGLTGAVGSVDKSSDKVKLPESQPPPPTKKEVPQPTSMVFPICGLKGIDPEACIPKEVVKNSRTLFNVLKEELTQRANWKGCHPNTNERVTLQEAKSILYQLTDLRKADVDSAFQGMVLLVAENPKAGLFLKSDSEEFAGKEIISKDVMGLDYAITKVCSDGHPFFVCAVASLITSLAMYLTVIGAVAVAGWGLWKIVLYRRQKQSAEENEVFKYVEKVLSLLYQQYELSENSLEKAFLAVNHVRDELVPPQERQKKEALWNKVVDYISNHESRIREEIQHISGEEFKVWRWLPSASPLASKRLSSANSKPLNRFTLPTGTPFNTTPAHVSAAPGSTKSHLPVSSLYPSLSELNDEDDEGRITRPGGSDDNSNKWQGQAFETSEGSPNALPSTPTTCLKIRHMYTERDATPAERSRIEGEILGKCRSAKILHIGIDPTSVEGCVYLRCLTKEDSRNAFASLHGWWFDGHLLSVKFLREERYFSRFPEAKRCTVPLSLTR